eukprot:4740534-Pyramimonas_sp.AAC.1
MERVRTTRTKAARSALMRSCPAYPNYADDVHSDDGDGDREDDDNKDEEEHEYPPLLQAPEKSPRPAGRCKRQGSAVH